MAAVVEGEIGGNCNWCNCVDSNTEHPAFMFCVWMWIVHIYLVDIRLETVDSRTKHLTSFLSDSIMFVWNCHLLDTFILIIGLFHAIHEPG